MKRVRKTRVMLAEENLSYHAMVNALRSGKCLPPERDCSVDFVWDDASVLALKRAIACDRRRKEHRPLARTG